MQVIRKNEIETPALLVDLDILESNIRKMAESFQGKRAMLRPHFKIHKCARIAHMQLAAGAKGLSCAKLSEAEVLATSGVNDILIANQIVDSQKVYRLARLAKNARITVCVDNTDNVAELSKAADACSSTIHVLVELEVGLNRCGVETNEEVLKLAKQISSSKGLVFEGFQAYAGHVCHLLDREERVSGTQKAEAIVKEKKEYVEAAGLEVKEISGAGTGTYNIHGNYDLWTEIQAGAYVFMDTNYCKLNLGFGQSLTVLTGIIHKRSGIAITDAGLKTCSNEAGPPVILGYPELPVVLHEEHGNIIDKNDELRYRQKLEYMPSHCGCSVNLHDHYYCVRNDMLEAIWPISARGYSK